jgi:DNA-directed RNA polymerase subunit RPC12/RpoP
MNSEDLKSCPSCGGTLRIMLCDDMPGAHTYVYVCTLCHREAGDEWQVLHQKPVPSSSDEEEQAVEFYGNTAVAA